MSGVSNSDPKALVAAVRKAAEDHGLRWAELVPDVDTVNVAAEDDEENAYRAMDAARRRLRDHIFTTYGLTPGELASLAAV